MGPKTFLPELPPDLRKLLFDEAGRCTLEGVDVFGQDCIGMSFEEDVDMIPVMVVFQKYDVMVLANGFPDLPDADGNGVINDLAAVFGNQD